jgi:hypothetical protein
LLTRADPDNAMAWLTLGYAADHSLANPDEITLALERAVAASRFHDYDFDVTKRALAATGRVPIPQELMTSHGTSEQFRQQFATPFEIPARLIVEWVNQGCNATHAVPAPSATACTKAKDLFRRGDSEETLSGDAEAAAMIRTAFALSHPVNGDAFGKATIDAYTQSGNAREFAATMKRWLDEH